MEFPDTGGEFLFQVFGIEITYLNTTNFDAARLVTFFQRPPLDLHVALVVGGLEVQDGGDVNSLEDKDILRCFGTRPHVQIRNDLVVVHRELKSYSRSLGACLFSNLAQPSAST